MNIIDLRKNQDGGDKKAADRRQTRILLDRQNGASISNSAIWSAQPKTAEK